jgi:hypothetical protein
MIDITETKTWERAMIFMAGFSAGIGTMGVIFMLIRG